LLWKSKKQPTISFPQIEILKKAAGKNSFWKYLPIILRVLIFTLLIFSLARPRLSYKQQEIKGKGIDIMLTLDVSGSMQAIDFKPTNRLEAAKKVAAEFIEKRRNDRIGLVKFAENAYTQCPLTLDYNILMSILEKIEINKEANGTAIGLGLATAVARLKDSQAKSKVIILITDGRNNTGEISPETAAELAATYDIKVYPIGVGSKSLVNFPFQVGNRIQYRKVKIELDMDSLNMIAAKTGTGKASLATNTQQLESIIEMINKMEKSELKIENYYEYQELFSYFLAAALLLTFLELALRTLIKFAIP
jgi:Ca-activated chloride channel family protein